jgi:hypothetical protein
MVLASFDAKPASGAIIFINTNNLIPVLVPTVQVTCNPQYEHNTRNNIYHVHYSKTEKIRAQNYALPEVRAIEQIRQVLDYLQ